MTAIDAALAPAAALPATRVRTSSARTATLAALWAFIIRDLTVLDKNLMRFVPSAVVQPTLLVFVFAYLFPAIGQGIGGQSGVTTFSTLLLPGIVANAIIFVGIFSVGMNLILELDANELEDRVLAPAPIITPALAKIIAGAIQAQIAGLIVFPIAAFLPATGLALQATWPVLLTFMPLACITSASLGLALGVIFNTRSGPWMFSVVALPLSFFGAVFYTWDSLAPVAPMKIAVLFNPLVYMSEGLRAAAVTGVPHMPIAVTYPVLAGFALLFAVIGVVGFRRRVLK